MSALDDLRAAGDAFAQRLAGVTDDQWDLSTPCTEWSVHDLFAHVAGGNRFAVALLAGASTREARAVARSLDRTEDAQSVFRRTADEQLAAFSEPGAFERTCHHPVGDIPGAHFIGLRTGDLIVHAWDLATAVGGEQDLGDDLVQLGLRIYRPMAGRLGQTGIFGVGATQDPAGLTPQQRLLDIVGRTA
ncbi:MAG TPA: TIGR03086 family metal-binding protein [Actinomycetes bacterium]